MSRLLPIPALLFASVSPATAAVCDRVLGTGYARLMNAPLWYSVGDKLLSPYTLILTVIAVLTATKMPRLRGIALIAALVTAVQAVTAIGANVFPDDLLLAARLEGCGAASLAGAIVSSALALLLTTSFLLAPDAKSGPHA